MMSKKVKIFALVVVGLAAVIGGFSLFGGSSVEEGPSTGIPRATGMPTPSSGITTSAVPGGGMPGAMPGGPVAALPGGPMGMPNAGQTSAAANEFSGLLSSVNSISIDTSIFQNTAYKTLRDYPVMLGTDIIGRINPFAPIGNDQVGSVAVGNAVLVQTLAPGKITTTGAEFGAAVTLPDTVPASVVFQYGISDTFGSTTSPLTLAKSGTPLVVVSGLTPGTKYFVQAVVVRGSGTTIGNVMTFTTAGASGSPLAQ